MKKLLKFIAFLLSIFCIFTVLYIYVQDDIDWLIKVITTLVGGFIASFGIIFLIDKNN